MEFVVVGTQEKYFSINKLPISTREGVRGAKRKKEREHESERKGERQTHKHTYKRHVTQGLRPAAHCELRPHRHHHRVYAPKIQNRNTAKPTTKSERKQHGSKRGRAQQPQCWTSSFPFSVHLWRCILGDERDNLFALRVVLGILLHHFHLAPW